MRPSCERNHKREADRGECVMLELLSDPELISILPWAVVYENTNVRMSWTRH